MALAPALFLQVRCSDLRGRRERLLPMHQIRETFDSRERCSSGLMAWSEKFGSGEHSAAHSVTQRNPPVGGKDKAIVTS